MLDKIALLLLTLGCYSIQLPLSVSNHNPNELSCWHASCLQRLPQLASCTCISILKWIHTCILHCTTYITSIISSYFDFCISSIPHVQEAPSPKFPLPYIYIYIYIYESINHDSLILAVPPSATTSYITSLSKHPTFNQKKVVTSNPACVSAL